MGYDTIPEPRREPGPLVYVTMGDPSGVGPEIIAKALVLLAERSDARLILVGDRKIIGEELDRYGPPNRDGLTIVESGEPLSSSKPGGPSDQGARSSLKALEKAVELMMSPEGGSRKALVTGPVCKGAIARISPGFVGHTEFLQRAYGVEKVTMAFTGENLRVVPVTRHVPLKEVSERLNSDLIYRTIEQVLENRHVLTDSPEPRLLVTALNPHGGEGGKIGDEEEKIIGPAIERAKVTYSLIEGPVPSDVAFYKAFGRDDVIVVAMYHDQCLGPFKMVDFTNGVNVTLGLKHIRTSPDHGTAFDISGKGIADPGSMLKAFEIAIKAARDSGGGK